MGLGDEANGRREYTSQLSIPHFCSLQLTAALHDLNTSGAGLHVLHVTWEQSLGTIGSCDTEPCGV